MTVKELRDILESLPNNLPVRDSWGDADCDECFVSDHDQTGESYVSLGFDDDE